MEAIVALVGLIVCLWLLGVVFNTAMFGLGAIVKGIAVIFGGKR